MSAADIQALANLLEQAIAHAVADIGGFQQEHCIGADAYREMAASSRRLHYLGSHSPSMGYALEIRDAKAHEQLLAVIGDELGQFIHDDRIQSATVATVGGALDGFEVRHLLSHLMDIAIRRGTRYAATNFYKWVAETSVQYQRMTLLSGIHIERPVEISKGIQLVPLPLDGKELPGYLPLLGPSGPQYTEFLGKTLLIEETIVSPVFVNPDVMTADSHEDLSVPQIFTRTNVCDEYPEFTAARFCEALSLVANHAVEYVAWWSYIGEDEFFTGPFYRSGGGYNRTALQNRDTASVTSEQVQEAVVLYRALNNLGSADAKKLEVPIVRWIKSKTDPNHVDKFIDLGIALESLYLGDIGNASELRFRLALRAAWHLGNNAEERETLLRDFKGIYDSRSQAVHAGAIKRRDAQELARRAQELCRDSIVKIISDGKFPNWDKLVLGAHQP